ncbi:hypothetical protein CIB84_015857 [Bambusicola thoracicus]|uniref:Uncharacterized protein n=1 Tax=Bambusicola thoracicus TaxID=9083 RepID=A0A2P4S8F3_BAMTH|nr:hypothetical protein CIB84_015857 [Bambusicola thoracicus]
MRDWIKRGRRRAKFCSGSVLSNVCLRSALAPLPAQYPPESEIFRIVIQPRLILSVITAK